MINIRINIIINIIIKINIIIIIKIILNIVIKIKSKVFYVYGGRLISTQKCQISIFLSGTQYTLELQ